MRWTWDRDKAKAIAPSMACRSKPRCWCLTIRSTCLGLTHTRTVIAGTPSDSWGRSYCWLFILGPTNRKKPSQSAVSSALGRLPLMKGKPMKKGASNRLTPKQRAELKSLAALRNDAIDTSDAPQLLDWFGAKRGLFYRPVKQQLTLRLDSDVVAWFKSHTTASEGYQTRINRALREYVQGQASRTRRSRA